ncbi:ATP synthase F1 subunit delta [Nemorincola caseinilytica]|uniref:ATP synthase subunit delta n=1 Tax=Nemorincola caseinilytica TaxID=2054315 RepID=A0ABP8NAU7_9BACT
MQNPRLASRYAKSLMDLAVEHNDLDAVLADMRTLQGICAVSRDFELMLRSPVIKGDMKLGVINAVLEKSKMNKLTKAFIHLLVSKGREMNLPEIATAFIASYNELKRIKTVKLTTARPVNDKVRDGIKAKVASFMPNDTVNMETSVDESLIGGFVLEVGDKLFDASVRRSLSEIRSKITDHSYESKM